MHASVAGNIVLLIALMGISISLYLWTLNIICGLRAQMSGLLVRPQTVLLGRLIMRHVSNGRAFRPLCNEWSVKAEGIVITRT